MSQKSQFLIASALSMSLFPYLLTLVPERDLSAIVYYIYEVPLKLLLPNLNLPDFSLIIFIIWFIIGLLWGYVLYLIRSQGNVENVKFGFGAFLTTVFVWLFLGAMLILVNQFLIASVAPYEDVLW